MGPPIKREDKRFNVKASNVSVMLHLKGEKKEQSVVPYVFKLIKTTTALPLISKEADVLLDGLEFQPLFE